MKGILISALLSVSCGVWAEDPGFLGVALQDLNETLAAQVKAPNTNGALISRVNNDTPAARAGLKPGDVIVRYDNKAIDDAPELCKYIAATAPTTIVPVTVLRDGNYVSMEVTVGQIPTSYVLSLDQHKTFFEDVTRLAGEEVVVYGIGNRIESYKAESKRQLTKDEFETTSEFEQRKAEYAAGLEKQAKAIEEELRTSTAIVEQIQAAITQREQTTKCLTTRLKLKMGPYDADMKTVTSCVPDYYSFGVDSGKMAVVWTTLTLPPFVCAAEEARKLREASDKGCLYCLVSFGYPQLKLVRSSIQVPTTTGERLLGGFGKAVGEVIARSFAGGNVPPAGQFLPDPSFSKDQAANIIQINKADWVQYINFCKEDGSVLVPEKPASRFASP